MKDLTVNNIFCDYLKIICNNFYCNNLNDDIMFKIIKIIYESKNICKFKISLLNTKFPNIIRKNKTIKINDVNFKYICKGAYNNIYINDNKILRFTNDIYVKNNINNCMMTLNNFKICEKNNLTPEIYKFLVIVKKNKNNITNFYPLIISKYYQPILDLDYICDNNICYDSEIVNMIINNIKKLSKLKILFLDITLNNIVYCEKNKLIKFIDLDYDLCEKTNCIKLLLKKINNKQFNSNKLIKQISNFIMYCIFICSSLKLNDFGPYISFYYEKIIFNKLFPQNKKFFNIIHSIFKYLFKLNKKLYDLNYNLFSIYMALNHYCLNIIYVKNSNYKEVSYKEVIYEKSNTLQLFKKLRIKIE